MSRNLSKLTKQIYDVLIIGGGINGAAIAHLAVLNGLKTALFEKDDFASGTSSKSTKLIHGGLRYLENFEFDLIREALKERYILLRDCPHLVKPLRFIVPVYKADARPLWKMKLGVLFYDLLSGKYAIERHRALRPQEVIENIPDVKREGLAGGVMYSDAQMDDARLCLENVLSARELGAQVANYADVRSIMHKNNEAVGAIIFDRINEYIYEVRAKKVICALGPWTNGFIKEQRAYAKSQVRTTKGIHIVCRKQIARHALLIPTQNEKRIFFIIPWMGNSLIGTTDTDFAGNPEDAGVEAQDVDYLLKETSRIFNKTVFTKDDIITAFAGLRPLVHEEGHPSEVSRKHVITRGDSGVVFVMGGKYTTFRQIAQDALTFIGQKNLKDTESRFPIYGNTGPANEDPHAMAAEYGVSFDTVKYLAGLYGTRCKEILALVKQDSGLKEPLCVCSPSIKAQVVYAIKNEMAFKEEDIFARRLSLVYRDCLKKACISYIQEALLKYK